MVQWQLPESDRYFRRLLEATPEGFELDHLLYALNHVVRRRLAVDAGAHVGTWSVRLAACFDKVLAFEPAPDTYACLEANIVGYANIVPMAVALGSHWATCNMVDDPSRPGNSGARIVELDPRGFVGMERLDHFNLKDLDFLKIDVEGFEIKVLEGARETIKRNSPVIVMECKAFVPPRYGGPEVAKNYLKELGYREVGGIRNDRVFIK